jgi:eukaryotic-like serine/threonine-protein kinase
MSGWGLVLVSELRPEDPQAIGPYRLVRQLGQGGMGRVFLGVSPGGRPVAVKAIRAELAADPDFRRRFGREVASARRVSGMFTAQVVDADVDGPVAWMATAYVPGPSLAEAVDTYGPLPEASLLALAAGLAESLSAIHAAGVVHRDLKPSNILLAEDGPRVIDFGISRAAESTMLTQAGLVVGSPGFMSPEQATGYQIGPPSDIFTLGAVLAFAATGEGPFGTGTTAALLYRVVHGAPSLDRVPPALRPLIEHCLAKDPSKRPTASGLLAEVGALQPGGNWLPESITRTFAAGVPPTPVPGVPPTPVPGGMPTPIPGGVPPTPPAGLYGPAPVTPPPDGRNRPPRRRVRPLVLALVIGGIVGAGGAAAFAVASMGPSNTPLQDRPAAATSPAPAPLSASPSVSSSSASPSASPSAYSSSSAPTYAATSQPASASPTTTPTPTTSPTPTATATSPTPTATATSPTPTATATSPTPTATATASSASASSSPASAPASSAPASTAASTSPATPAPESS